MSRFRLVAWEFMFVFAACVAIGAAAEPNESEGESLPEGAVARCGTTRLRLPGLPADAGHFEFRPDSRAIAAWNDTSLRLWDVADGRRLWQRPGTAKITAATFSPDSRLLAIARAGGVVELLDAATGRELRQFRGAEVVTAAFGGAGRWLALARRLPEAAIEVWNTTDGTRSAELTFGETTIGQLACSRDGRWLCAVGLSGPAKSRQLQVLRWETDDWKRLPDFTRSPPSYPYVLGDDGRMFAVGSAVRQEVAIWDVATNRRATVLPIQPKHVTLSAGSELCVTSELLSQEQQTRVKIWSTATGEPQHELRFSRWLGEQARLSPDGRVLATVLRERGVCLWDVSTGRRRLMELDHDGPVAHLAFSLDGRTVVSTGLDLRTWDAQRGQALRMVANTTGPFQLLPDGRELVAPHHGALRRIDLASGQAIGEPLTIPTGSEEPAAIADLPRFVWLGLSTDSRALVALTRSPGSRPDGQILHRRATWDLKTWTPVINEPARTRDLLDDIRAGGEEALHTRHVRAAAANGQRWTTTFERFDLRTGKTLSQLFVADDYLHLATVSPDGSTLAAVTSSHGAALQTRAERIVVRVWSWPAGVTRAEIPLEHPELHDPVTLNLSPDGRQLAIARVAGRIEIYDVTTGRMRLHRAGYESRCGRLVFRADGRRLASSHADGTILIWDVP